MMKRPNALWHLDSSRIPTYVAIETRRTRAQLMWTIINFLRRRNDDLAVADIDLKRHFQMIYLFIDT